VTGRTFCDFSNSTAVTSACMCRCAPLPALQAPCRGPAPGPCAPGCSWRREARCTARSQPGTAHHLSACRDGDDSCITLGACISQCDLPGTRAFLAEVTQAIKTCSVDGDCAASEQCSPDASCVTYTCDGVTGLQKTACDSEPPRCLPALPPACPPRRLRLVHSPCAGLPLTHQPPPPAEVCTPKAPIIASAIVTDSGRAINVTLSTEAQATFAPCSYIFDAATLAKIGFSSVCSSSGDAYLLVNMIGSPSLVPGTDTLVLRAGQAWLTSKVGALAFAGSIGGGGTNTPVAICANCPAPAVSIAGPATLSAPCSIDEAATGGWRRDAVRAAQAPASTP
jgi:hypothetical protein